MVLFLTAGLLYAGEVLNVGNDTWTALQSNGAVMYTDAFLTTNPIACFDMGSIGTLQIPFYAMPQGPFSIEGKFFLRSYNGSDPNISDIFASFNTNYGGANNSEGFDFRVGGGYNYALKAQDAYSNVSDWTLPDGSQKTAR